MTRRLVAAILATVVGTLLVAGATTLLIARWQARETTEDVLRDQAESLAVVAGGVDDTSRPREQAVARRVLRDLRRALRVDGVEFVRFDATGAMTGNLPDGVEPDDLDPDVLAAGGTVSGAHGSLVYAAAPEVRPRATVVAVVTREATTGLGAAVPWFLLASVVTLVLGALGAVLLGRRLARPVDDAAHVARRIAGGELAARLPEPAERDRDELAGLARSINAMAGGLERARTLEQQFLLSVSHDLRTPLTSIRGYADAIADGTAPDHAAAAGVILAESARLERLVSDVLDLAHLDGRSFSLHPVDHDARQTVADAIRAFTPLAGRNGLAVTTDDGDPVVVHADPARLQQILGNLLENAAKYARSRIDVRVTVADKYAVVRVDDDGPGIAPDDRPHVFERLYAARHRPVRAEVGTGLGLAIVRQLAEAMGGSVEAGSSPVGGARIEVRLPLAVTREMPPVITLP